MARSCATYTNSLSHVRIVVEKKKNKKVLIIDVINKLQKKDNRPYLEPKPDYDSLDSSVNTVSRLMNKEKIKANHETAELESIDSFQLSNPQTNVPSPPSMYFSSPRSYPPTLKKAPKQVSVMINTYDDKTEPGKFGFFESSDKGYHQHATNNGDMSSRLKSELEKTLSRSNLKHRSESIVSLIIAPKFNYCIDISISFSFISFCLIFSCACFLSGKLKCRKWNSTNAAACQEVWDQHEEWNPQEWIVELNNELKPCQKYHFRRY